MNRCPFCGLLFAYEHRCALGGDYGSQVVDEPRDVTPLIRRTPRPVRVSPKSPDWMRVR